MIALTNYAKQIRKLELTASIQTQLPLLNTTRNVEYNESGEPINMTIDSDGVTIQRMGIKRTPYGQTQNISFGGKITGRMERVIDNKDYNVEEEFVTITK